MKNQTTKNSRKAFYMPRNPFLILAFVVFLTMPLHAEEKATDATLAQPTVFVPGPVSAAAPSGTFGDCPTMSKTGEADPNCATLIGEEQPKTCSTCPGCVVAQGGFCGPEYFAQISDGKIKADSDSRTGGKSLTHEASDRQKK